LSLLLGLGPVILLLPERKDAERIEGQEPTMTNHFGKIAAILYFAFAVGFIGLIGNMI
jgi:hypothetical protein